MTSATAWSMREFCVQVLSGHPFVIADTYRWYRPVAISRMTFPPQEVRFGAIPYPCGQMTGRKDRVSHSGPFQGLSHRHCEPNNSPLSEHGGADVAERPLARMASMPIDFQCVNVTGRVYLQQGAGRLQAHGQVSRQTQAYWAVGGLDGGGNGGGACWQHGAWTSVSEERRSRCAGGRAALAVSRMCSRCNLHVLKCGFWIVVSV